MYPRSQAACKVLGVPMTEENGQNCLAKLERGDLEVIYVEEVGHRQPFAVGKQTIVQDPVYFRKYIDVNLWNVNVYWKVWLPSWRILTGEPRFT